MSSLLSRLRRSLPMLRCTDDAFVLISLATGERGVTTVVVVMTVKEVAPDINHVIANRDNFPTTEPSLLDQRSLNKSHTTL
jgi:hypothetical protein